MANGITASDVDGDFGPGHITGDPARLGTLMHAADFVADSARGPERYAQEIAAARLYLAQ